jgi:hypothetical protein
LPVQIRATNLSAQPQTLTLTATLNGASLAPLPAGVLAPLTLAPQQAVTTTFTVNVSDQLTISEIRALTIAGKLRATAPTAGAAPLVSPVAIPLLLEGTLAQHLARFPRQEKLPLEDLTRWRDNIAALGKMRVELNGGAESDGDGAAAAPASARDGVKILLTWHGAGDRWVYPQFSLPRGGLTKFHGVVVRAKVAKPATVRMMLFRQGEGVYWTASPIIPADGEWHAVYLAFGDFDPLRGGNFELNTAQRDLTNMDGLAVGLHDGAAQAENELVIRELFLVGE